MREAAGIGERVAHFRHKAGLSAQELAERCAKLGLKSISRVVIAKLETGKREAVSTAELKVLAQALEVPAVVLLFPIGRAKTIEVLPGQDAEPWAAYEWFIGNSADPAYPSADPQMGTFSPIVLWSEHLEFESLIEMLCEERHQRVTGIGDRSTIDMQIDAYARGLRRIRAAMREQDMTPPSLRPESARILGGEG